MTASSSGFLFLFPDVLIWQKLMIAPVSAMTQSPSPLPSSGNPQQGLPSLAVRKTLELLLPVWGPHFLPVLCECFLVFLSMTLQKCHVDQVVYLTLTVHRCERYGSLITSCVPFLHVTIINLLTFTASWNIDGSSLPDVPASFCFVRLSTMTQNNVDRVHIREDPSQFKLNFLSFLLPKRGRHDYNYPDLSFSQFFCIVPWAWFSKYMFGVNVALYQWKLTWT